MNSISWRPRGLAFYAIAIIGTFLLMAWLVSFVRKYTVPPPLNAARAQERSKALAELEAENANVLNNFGWVDQSKGFVRLPVSLAVELTIQEWQQPAAARAKLVKLANKIAGPAPSSPAPAPLPGPPATAPPTNPPAAK